MRRLGLLNSLGEPIHHSPLRVNLKQQQTPGVQKLVDAKFKPILFGPQQGMQARAHGGSLSARFPRILTTLSCLLQLSAALERLRISWAFEESNEPGCPRFQPKHKLSHLVEKIPRSKQSRELWQSIQDPDGLLSVSDSVQGREHVLNSRPLLSGVK